MRFDHSPDTSIYGDVANMIHSDSFTLSDHQEESRCPDVIKNITLSDRSRTRSPGRCPEEQWVFRRAFWKVVLPLGTFCHNTLCWNRTVPTLVGPGRVPKEKLGFPEDIPEG